MKIINRIIEPFTKLDIQIRLIVGFLFATFFTGAVATVISIWTINKNTIAEVQNRVKQDMNTAKLIYNNALERIAFMTQITAERADLKKMVATVDLTGMKKLNGLIRNNRKITVHEDTIFLDMLTLVDPKGNVIFRAANHEATGDSLLWNPVVKTCLENKTLVSSTERVPIEKILKENKDLAERLDMEIIKIPLSFEPKEKKLEDGLVMQAACPVFDENKKLIGAVLGGVLLNKDYSIVDKIKETLYHGEKYRGRDVGVATLFQGGIRIATNVMTEENKRAVGTTLSKEVYDRVILEGKDWVGKAFVVHDWYITTYSPIYDMKNNLIGSLYTGILEAKYREIKWHTILINMVIIGIGMIIALIISFHLGNTIITRIRLLKEAAESIAAGNLDYELSPDKISGFEMVDKAFNYMSRRLKERDEQLHKAHDHLARTEKLTALGEMAAGVAHEINNPLGGILLYSNLALEDIPKDSPARGNIQKIVDQTNRCKDIVKNLLDFARTPTGVMIPLKMNSVINTALTLIKDQSMFHGIKIERNFAEKLPDVLGDRSRLEEVFINLFINASDAMKGSGKLTVTTIAENESTVKILVEDNGKGIDKVNLPHIFEPFFTTKEPGLGTGLGLSIVYGIIKKHNGYIDVESEPGKGTIFTITLPAIPGSYTGDADDDIFYS